MFLFLLDKIIAGVAVAMLVAGTIVAGLELTKGPLAGPVSDPNLAGVITAIQPEEGNTVSSQTPASQNPPIFSPPAETPAPAVVEQTPPPPVVTVPEPRFSVPQAGFGGGGGPLPIPPPPAAPALLSPDPLTLFATSTITFTGTAEAGTTIFTDASFSTSTATTDGSGNWMLPLSVFPEGTTTLNFFASNANGTSPALSVSIFVDTINPAINGLDMEDCSESTQGVCFTTDTSLGLIITTNATDIAYFQILMNDSLLATTTSLTYSPILVTPGQYKFTVTAYDATGNVSPAKTKKTHVIIPTIGVVTPTGIGYYCADSDTFGTYLPGGTYNHAGTECHYLSMGAGSKFGALYRGAVGSATLVSNPPGNKKAHLLNSNDDEVSAGDELITSPVAEKQFFVAIYEKQSNNDDDGFDAYFTGATITRPHDNYAILPWTYQP